jgi:hypothetical protein
VPCPDKYGLPELAQLIGSFFPSMGVVVDSTFRSSHARVTAACQSQRARHAHCVDAQHLTGASGVSCRGMLELRNTKWASRHTSVTIGEGEGRPFFTVSSNALTALARPVG